MSRSKPHWVLIAVVPVLTALIAGIAALGGPEDAWLKTRSPFFGPPAPQIINFEAQPGRGHSYLLTIHNPALEDVVITGYEATGEEFANMSYSSQENATASNVGSEDGAGAVPLVTVQEPSPTDCIGRKRVRFPRPVVIESKRAGALMIEPWKVKCIFSIKVLSDHGTSQPADNLPPISNEFGPSHG